MVALSLDTIFVLVPATWNVPNAGPIPMTPNKGFVEGCLEALPADVVELVSAGATLPASLFEAEGTSGEGARLGVRVGVYETGSADPIALVRKSVLQVAPEIAVSSTSICGREGVRVVRRWDDGLDGDRSVICDYWGRVRGAATSVILLRCWRFGPPIVNEEELFDDVAGSVIFDDGGSFAGPARRAITLNRYGPPQSEVAEPGRFRYIGWRLGRVFYSRMLSTTGAELATEIGFRRRDGLLMLAVFIPWIVATLALVGMGPILMVGGLSFAGTLPQLRSRGPKAVVILAIVLLCLLGFGVATS